MRNCCNKRSTGAARPTDGGCAKLYQSALPSSMQPVNDDTGSHIGTISKWKWLKIWRNAVSCVRLSAALAVAPANAAKFLRLGKLRKQYKPPHNPLGGRCASNTSSSCRTKSSRCAPAALVFVFCPATSYCWRRQYIRFVADRAKHFGFERVQIIAPKSIIA